jgi:ABC-type uncharacterized transport system permease subunit
MAALSYLLLALGAAAYAVSASLFFALLARKETGRSLSRPDLTAAAATAARGDASRPLGPTLLALGAVLHLGYICIASFLTHECPVGSVHFVLSFVAIIAIFTFTLARARATRAGPRENIDALGLLVAPLGLAFLLGTYFLDKPAVGSSVGTFFLALHVLTNVVGIALFFLAGAAASLYLVQERRLKHKKLARAFGLPPLDTLDRATHRFLAVGFPLLTVGILSGTFWAYQLESGSFDEVMRIVFGYATWLLIALVLLLRVAAGWRGKRSAYGTLLGLGFAVCVIIVYVLRPAATAPPVPAATEPGARL